MAFFYEGLLFGIQILPHDREVVRSRPYGEEQGQSACGVGDGRVGYPPSGEESIHEGDGVQGGLNEHGADKDDLCYGLDLAQQVGGNDLSRRGGGHQSQGGHGQLTEDDDQQGQSDEKTEEAGG